jgi:hypothetical protein
MFEALFPCLESETNMSQQNPSGVHVQGGAPPATEPPPFQSNGASSGILPPPPAHQPEPVRFSWSYYIITVLVLEVIFWLLLFVTGISDSIRGNPGARIIMFMGVAIFASGFHFSVFLLRKLYSRFWEKRSIERDISQLQENLSEDFFTNLVRINFKYIDKYYLQTQVQANRSFTLASVAASVSLFIILLGIVMMYYGGNDKLTPAYMTTVSGLLGEFISAVFFYLYNRTVLEMSQYHQKLVLTQNVGLALKIAQTLPEIDKPKAQVGLIECLSKDINMYLTMHSSTLTREVVASSKQQNGAGPANGG